MKIHKKGALSDKTNRILKGLLVSTFVIAPIILYGFLFYIFTAPFDPAPSKYVFESVLCQPLGNAKLIYSYNPERAGLGDGTSVFVYELSTEWIENWEKVRLSTTQVNPYSGDSRWKFELYPWSKTLHNSSLDFVKSWISEYSGSFREHKIEREFYMHLDAALSAESESWHSSAFHIPKDSDHVFDAYYFILDVKNKKLIYMNCNQ